jgi:peroxiredoxin
MLQIGDHAPEFSLLRSNEKPFRYSRANGGKTTLLAFIETDCPACRLTLPYLNRLAESIGEAANIIAVSQDAVGPTRKLAGEMDIAFPVVIDHDLSISRLFDPKFVPALFLMDPEGKVVRAEVGFDKNELNEIATIMADSAGIVPAIIADAYDGAPQFKPGCSSRHLESDTGGEEAAAANVALKRGARASRVELNEGVDPYDYCVSAGFTDPLPVVPPTIERVERMLAATALAPDEIVGLIPPNYGAATVEKIAANAVMAGCPAEMMRVLIPLVRAVCDERFNIHGVQATTHFAAPLIIVNGPVRKEMGFACGSNVFGNVARANSTLGRALQLILTNLGGARPGEIDMSTLGNSGKFSYCIAENEEENPWEPLHVELGFRQEQSTVTVFAAEPPKGVSEHNAREAHGVLRAICAALATSWTYRLCGMAEAVVVLCPEHVKTIRRDGLTKQDVRDFLFDNTGIPLKAYRDYGEGTEYSRAYERITIDGEDCYRKFRSREAITIVVAGGTAGKFSAVISSWATGPRGSQMVTYPVGSSQ